jgi:hypothetical protein
VLQRKSYSPRGIGRLSLRRKWVIVASFAIGVMTASLLSAWSHSPEELLNQTPSLGTVAIGGLVGIAVGFALAIRQEHRNPSFRSEDDIVQLLQVPVLGVIPLMSSDAERRLERRRGLQVKLVGIALLLGVVILLVYTKLGH